jgi:hypothetical protein
MSLLASCPHRMIKGASATTRDLAPIGARSVRAPLGRNFRRHHRLLALIQILESPRHVGGFGKSRHVLKTWLRGRHERQRSRRLGSAGTACRRRECLSKPLSGLNARDHPSPQAASFPTNQRCLQERRCCPPHSSGQGDCRPTRSAACARKLTSASSRRCSSTYRVSCGRHHWALRERLRAQQARGR